MIVYLGLSTNLWGQVTVLDNSLAEINLNKYCYNISDNNKDLSIEQIMDKSDWAKLKDNGPMFSLSLAPEWIRIDLNNPTTESIERYLFLPYHMIKKIDGYVVNQEKVIQTFLQGRLRHSSSKAIKSRGYNAKIKFPANSTTRIYLKLDNTYRFLRAPVFLLGQNRIHDVINDFEYLIWLWRGVLLTAIVITLCLFYYIRKNLFLYYILINAGLFVYISSEIGDYIQIFGIDPLGVEIGANHLGVIMAITFFALFLNELTPLSSRYPKIWKWSTYWLIVPWGLGFLSVIPFIQNTIVHTIAMTSIALTSMILLLILLVILLIKTIANERNALVLFVVYTLYATSIFLNAYLPNLALIEETPFTFYGMLMGSIVEIITFLFLMGKETLSIYTDRASLLEKQKSFQREMIVAVIKSQEQERNKVGRELHDMIGANLSVLKQRMSSEDEDMKVLSQTIEVVRGLSHGLVTPKVKNEEFIDELMELCHLFTSDKLSVYPYFYNWVDTKDSSISNHLFRICQELLQNAVKHSQANEVNLQLIGSESHARLMYEDDGIGFGYQVQRKKGLGLKNIENRVELINGTIEFDTIEYRKGTTIVIDIPHGG